MEVSSEHSRGCKAGVGVCNSSVSSPLNFCGLLPADLECQPGGGELSTETVIWCDACVCQKWCYWWRHPLHFRGRLSADLERQPGGVELTSESQARL